MTKIQITLKCPKCEGLRWLRDNKIPGIDGIVKCHICKGEGKIRFPDHEDGFLPFEESAATNKK